MRAFRTAACIVGALAAAPVATATAATYHVRWGDTLSGIALREGTTVAQLARLNGLRPNGILLAGSTLRLPHHRAGGRQVTRLQGRYRVVWGDTLTGIASAYGMSLDRLAAVNGLDPYGVLVTGTVLRVPASGTIAARPASAPAETRAGGCRGTVGCTLDHWSRWYGVDRHLVRGLAWQESGWSAWIVSSAGARGALQVLPATRAYVQTYLIGHPVAWTPSGDIRIGVAYLHHLLQTFAGNERLAVAAYYQGPSAVWRYGVLPATERYVANVLALRDRM